MRNKCQHFSACMSWQLLSYLKGKERLCFCTLSCVRVRVCVCTKTDNYL